MQAANHTPRAPHSPFWREGAYAVNGWPPANPTAALQVQNVEGGRSCSPLTSSKKWSESINAPFSILVSMP